jgi:hypothetical protein
MIEVSWFTASSLSLNFNFDTPVYGSRPRKIMLSGQCMPHG